MKNVEIGHCAAILLWVSVQGAAQPVESAVGSDATRCFARDSRLDADFVGVSVVELDGRFAIQDGELRSMESFSPPITIHYRVKSDGANARFGFAAEQILFDWETNPTQLRIDGGPAGGHHLHGKGRLPTDRFVTITQTVAADRMDVTVDGESRGRWYADFSKVHQPIRVHTVDWATLIVESIRIEREPTRTTPPIVEAAPEAAPREATKPAGFMPKGERFSDDFLAVRGFMRGGQLVIQDGMIASLGEHAPPVKITYRVKTDSNLTLGYGAWQILFNWRPNPDDLRIDLGPIGGQHRPGKGRTPTGEFFTLEQIVTEDSMSIRVDGELRGSWQGDFREYRAPIKVFSHEAQIHVDSITIDDPK